MLLNPLQIAEEIRLPLHKWPGNCHAVATLLVEHKIVKGETRYGIWLGFIHPKSFFASRHGPARHGWIEKADGTIVDPTRWVFEAAPPYIYVGPDNGEYDFGATTLRQMGRGPCPAFNPDEKVFRFHRLSKKAKSVIRQLITHCPTSQISIQQLFYLSNMPLADYNGCAAEIYLKAAKAPTFLECLTCE
jgi:hypothetical protein